MRALIAVVAVMTLAAPAHAGWQFTQWGMTVDEVRAAAPGTITETVAPALDTETLKARLQSEHAAQGYRFRATYLFDAASDRLARVRLDLADPSQCQALGNELRTIYGRPEIWPMRGVTRWRDEPNGNAVVFDPLGMALREPQCSVHYFEIKPRSASGL